MGTGGRFPLSPQRTKPGPAREFIASGALLVGWESGTCLIFPVHYILFFS